MLAMFWSKKRFFVSFLKFMPNKWTETKLRLLKKTVFCKGF
jgi:hypothetical protein